MNGSLASSAHTSMWNEPPLLDPHGRRLPGLGNTDQMTNDRTLISLSDLVRRASAIVDPNGADPAVGELVTRFGDDDEPVRGILDSLEERLAWGADEDGPIVMAQAIVLYLAHRLDEFDDDPAEILQLTARSEFDGRPPEPVAAWLEEQGIELG
jgi:hypothetical protein